MRTIYRFAEPVFFYNDSVFTRFIARLKKELRLTDIFPGLDPAIEKPDQFYAVGNGWTINEAAVISAPLLELWLHDCCKPEKFENGIEVPLHVVEAEVHKRWPGRWSGAFEEGSRGVRWWDASADAKSVLVKKTGVVCFTGHESFRDWQSIFGREFIQAYLADRRGKPLCEMFSDGTAYYRQLPTKTWDAMTVETARRHLRVVYGLTDKVPKAENASEMDMVLNHLEQRKRVMGAMPFPLNPNEIVTWNGMVFLNNSTARLCQPHPEAQDWGINFPWIAQYLPRLFLDERNLIIFLAWLQVWYKSAYKGQPCRGQSFFLVGPAGTGKSLLSRQILARVFGGYADARDHLVDGGRFNSSLFEKALWVLDDSTVLADRKSLDRFSALVKAMVANDSMQYEQKYGYSGAIPFVGRLFVTLNDDPISLGILPNTETSMLDKVIFCQTGDEPADVADTEAERYAIIDRELPFFLRWLLDWERPEWVQSDTRFGIKAWHDEFVKEEANSVTPSATVVEILDLWRSQKTGKEQIEITPTALYSELAEQYGHLMRGIPLTVFGKHVTKATSSGCAWIKQIRKGKYSDRYYVIQMRK